LKKRELSGYLRQILNFCRPLWELNLSDGDLPGDKIAGRRSGDPLVPIGTSEIFSTFCIFVSISGVRGFPPRRKGGKEIINILLTGKKGNA
jgi:hypothetical protein